MEQGIRSLLRQRPVWALLLIAVALGGFRLYTTVTAEGRLSPALKQAMAHTTSFPRILVRVDFQPEDFHIKYLQKYGMIGGVQQNSIILLNVTTENIRELSKIYWIQSIDLPEPSG